MATNSARSSTSPSNPERQRVEHAAPHHLPYWGGKVLRNTVMTMTQSATTPNLLDIDISAYKKLTKLLERETEILERESARISVGSLEQGTSISSNPTLPLA